MSSIYQKISGDLNVFNTFKRIKKASLCLFFMLSMSLVAQNWKEIKAGSEFSMGIKENGILWGWGFNGNGQLGIYPDGTQEILPVQIGLDSNWKTLSAGGFHTLAIKTDGTLWGWGYNEYGQVSNDATLSIYAPLQIGSDTDWVFVEACYVSSFAIKRNGTLWAWGYNNDGQLGVNDLIQHSQPTQVGTATWKTVSAGGFITMGIQEDNTLWRWGINVTYSDTAGYNIENDILPMQVGMDADWKAVSVGMEFAIALKNNGSLWTYGDNSNRQLGYDTVFLNDFFQIATEHTWKYIEVGSAFSFAITENQELYTWGNNLYGQLGLNTGTFVSTPTLVLDKSDIKQIAAAKGMMFGNGIYGLHTLILKNDNALCVAGANYVGQLGIGSTSNNPTDEFICNDDVGIVETDNYPSLRVYPNPTSGQLIIEMSDIEHRVSEIQIFDVVGRKIQSKIVNLKSEITIDISHLANGLYFLKIDNKVIKFVKE